MALPLYQKTLQLQKAKFGSDHPLTLEMTNNLAVTYQEAGKRDLALPLFEETLRLIKAKLGPDHPNTLTCMNNLAAAYWSAKQLDKSIPLFEEVLQRQEAKLGRQHPLTLLTVVNLGVNYRDAGRLAKALPLLEEGYRSTKQDPALRWVGLQLLEGYVQAGKTQQAIAFAPELLAQTRTQYPRESLPLAEQLAAIGRSLLRVQAFAKAEPLLRECLAIRGKQLPNHWTTYNTKSLLGGALLGQMKYADAEPLLLQGYEGLKQRETELSLQGKARLAEALERLVQLYDAWGKPDAAARWRKELLGK